MKLRGKVKGQTILFDKPLDLPEGQSVEVDICAIEVSEIEEDTGAGENVSENDDSSSLWDSPAYQTFRPIPARGRVVTNEMVNEIREELGI